MLDKAHWLLRLCFFSRCVWQLLVFLERKRLVCWDSSSRSFRKKRRQVFLLPSHGSGAQIHHYHCAPALPAQQLDSCGGQLWRPQDGAVCRQLQGGREQRTVGWPIQSLHQGLSPVSAWRGPVRSRTQFSRSFGRCCTMGLCAYSRRTS